MLVLTLAHSFQALEPQSRQPPGTIFDSVVRAVWPIDNTMHSTGQGLTDDGIAGCGQMRVRGLLLLFPQRTCDGMPGEF